MYILCVRTLRGTCWMSSKHGLWSCYCTERGDGGNGGTLIEAIGDGVVVCGTVLMTSGNGDGCDRGADPIGGDATVGGDGNGVWLFYMMLSCVGSIRCGAGEVVLFSSSLSMMLGSWRSGHVVVTFAASWSRWDCVL